MMVKELQLVDGPAENPDGSRLEASGRGYFPGNVAGLDVAVKDSKRFANTKGSGYFTFNHSPAILAGRRRATRQRVCRVSHQERA